MKKSHLIYIYIILFTSCKSYIIQNKEQITKTVFSESFNLDDYDVYVLKICKNASNKINREHIAEDIAFPLFSECKDGNSIIVEETYLLTHKNQSLNDKVIYITSYSYLNLKKGCGVFNCPIYKDKIFIEDIDKIYLGRIRNNRLEFYSRDEKNKYVSIWNFTRDKNHNLRINDVTLTESDFNPKPQILLDNIFSSKIVFKKEKRNFIYGKVQSKLQSCFKNCLDGKRIKLPQIKGQNIGEKVSKLHLSKGRFYFSSKREKDNFEEFYGFRIKRMPYYYKFID